MPLLGSVGLRDRGLMEWLATSPSALGANALGEREEVLFERSECSLLRELAFVLPPPIRPEVQVVRFLFGDDSFIECGMRDRVIGAVSP